MNAKPKLHIFYRHVHIKADKLSRDPNKSRPPWFSHENCFRNLLETIKSDVSGNNVNLTVMYDGTIEDLQEDFISKYLNMDLGIKLQLIKAGTDLNSFLITLHLANHSIQNENDLIYILENDYLHQNDWISKVYELYDLNLDLDFDFISLYDHNDKYIYDAYRNLESRIIATPSHHWRSAPSTCASFILSKLKLNSDIDIFTSGLTDYYFFNKLILERNRTLLTPIPGLATHSMQGYLSPTINWEQISEHANNNKEMVL